MGIEIVGDEVRMGLAGLSSLGTNHTISLNVVPGGAGVGKFDIKISRDWRECFGAPWIYQQDLTLGRGQIKLK